MYVIKNLLYLILALLDIIRLSAGIWICSNVAVSCTASHFGAIAVFAGLFLVVIVAWFKGPSRWMFRLLFVVIVLHVLILGFVMPDAIAISTTRV